MSAPVLFDLPQPARADTPRQDTPSGRGAASAAKPDLLVRRWRAPDAAAIALVAAAESQEEVLHCAAVLGALQIHPWRTIAAHARRLTDTIRAIVLRDPAAALAYARNPHLDAEGSAALVAWVADVLGGETTYNSHQAAVQVLAILVRGDRLSTTMPGFERVLALLDGRGFRRGGAPGECGVRAVRAALTRAGIVDALAPLPDASTALLVRLDGACASPLARATVARHPNATPAVWCAQLARRGHAVAAAIASIPTARADTEVRAALRRFAQGLPEVGVALCQDAAPAEFATLIGQFMARGSESALAAAGQALRVATAAQRGALDPWALRPLLESSRRDTRLAALAALGEAGRAVADRALDSPSDTRSAAALANTPADWPSACPARGAS